MPQIKEYNNRVGVAGPQGQAKASAGNMGNMLAQAGQQIAQAGNTIQDFNDKKDVYEAQKTYADAQSAWIDKMQEMKSNISFDENEPEFTAKVNEEFDKFHSQILDGKSGKGAEFLDAHMTKLKLELHNEATVYQAQARGQHEKGVLQQRFEENSNRVRQEPGIMPKLLETELGLINDNPYLPEPVKEQLRNERRQALMDKSIDGSVTLLETKKNVTIGEVDRMIGELSKDGAGYKENANPQMYDQGLTRLQRLKEHLTQKKDHESFIRFESDMDQIEFSGNDHGRWTEAEIRAKVSDSSTAERMIMRQAQARRVAQATSFVKDKPEGEVVKHLESLRQKAETSATPYEDMKSFTAAAQAFSRRQEMMKKDPAGYTMQVSTAVKGMYDNYAKEPTPENFSAYASAMVAEQKRLSPGIVPSLVTDEMAGQIKARLDSVGRSETGAGEALTVIESQIAAAGPKYWPIVVKDLKNAGALSDEHYVAATMYGKLSSRHVQEDLMRAAALKPEEIGADKDARDAAEADVKEALEDFKRTMGATPGEQKIYNSFEKALTKLALYKGADAEQIKSYAQKIVNDSYEFKDTYRIPVDQSPSSVQQGVEAIQSSLDKLDIVPPPSSLRDEDAKRRYMLNVKRSSTWITTGEGDGLKLVDEHGRDVLVREGDKVKPLRKTWAELRGVALETPRRGRVMLGD
jgi:hypothetical protein